MITLQLPFIRLAVMVKRHQQAQLHTCISKQAAATVKSSTWQCSQSIKKDLTAQKLECLASTMLWVHTVKNGNLHGHSMAPWECYTAFSLVFACATGSLSLLLQTGKSIFAIHLCMAAELSLQCYSDVVSEWTASITTKTGCVKASNAGWGWTGPAVCIFMTFWNSMQRWMPCVHTDTHSNC